MGEHIGRMVRLCWRDGLGFGLFLAWVYCALFGCGLATSDTSLIGTPATLDLERIWQFSGIAEAAGAAAGLVAATLAAEREARRPNAGGSRAKGTGPTEQVVAGIFGVVASIVIWAAWLDCDLWFYRLYWVGGLLAGCATALFTVAWGTRLSSANEAHIEFVVPLAFTIAFALYLLLLLFKYSAFFNLVCAVLMCTGSCGLLRTPVATEEGAGDASHRPKAQPAACPEPSERAPIDRTSLRGLLSFGALVCVSWVQIALYRVISSPALAGNRFTHYLYPFLMACVVSCVMVLLCIRVSRYLNVTLVFRWSMPLFVVSYVPLVIGYDDTTLRMAGYALNFLGMFGVQYGCWLGASKYARRSHVDAAVVFCCLALGEGLGIAVGCAVGFVARELPMMQMLALALLMLAGVQLVTMAVGFNPAWVLRRTRDRSATYTMRKDMLADASSSYGPSGYTGTSATEVTRTSRDAQPDKASAQVACPDPAALEELFHQQALWLQANFQLTNRETEVAELLLAGRSRPFIRDELYLSLNTVGVHVRSIFAKCNVHSQQELIDLGRSQGIQG